MHLKCCSPGNASRHMQATCVHTQACTHMQAHVLTCVNCKRTARRTHTRTFSICIHCTRAQNTDDNHGHLRVINDILIASLPGSSPTGRPDAGRDALRHPAMLLNCCSSNRLWSSLPRTAQERCSLDQLHSAARHCFAFQRQSSRESVRQTTTAAVLGHSVRPRQLCRTLSLEFDGMPH